MGWSRITDAAELLGVSRRTLEARVASGELPAYLDDNGIRQVWVGAVVSVSELQADELRQLRIAVERLAGERPVQVNVDTYSTMNGDAERHPDPVPVRVQPQPVVAAEDDGRQLVMRLVELAGGVRAAAVVLGLARPATSGRVVVSRLANGHRAPSPAMQARVVAALAELEERARAA